MKLSRSLFALCIILFGSVCLILSQDKPKKKDESKPVEMKINLMVLDSENKFINDVKSEDLKIFEDGVEQKITRLARKEPVLNLGLVFDNSGSVRKYLDEVIMTGKIVVNNLNPEDEAFVVRFVNSDKIAVTQDWTSDKAALNEALDNLYIEAGPTAVLDAIYLSAGKLLEREKIDKSKRYGIILVSDAEDRDSYYKLGEVSKLFRETDLQVFLISYAANAPQHKDRALKLANSIPIEFGGMVYSLPKKRDKNELIAALKAVMTEIRSNYVVGYVSSNPKRDGLARKLTVQIADSPKGEKRQGIIRESFIVPKN